MKLQRYGGFADYGGGISYEEDDMGDWMRAADVDALLARIRVAVDAERGFTSTVLAAQLMMIKRPLAESVYRCDSQRLATRAALDALLSGDETVHQCPPDGSSITPCCGRIPFEALADRMATDPALVTCRGRAG